MSVYDEVARAVEALCDLPREDLRPVRLLVIGCSTSEIAGGTIGHASAPEIGAEVARAAMDAAAGIGVSLAFQCCEHLNRALVVERATAEKYGLEIVSAVPYPKAGGSCASAAYRMMRDPVLAESVQADAGIDIGLTLIGMHLKSVAVPVRLETSKIGNANAVFARTRPRFIGGSRAQYAL